MGRYFLAKVGIVVVAVLFAAAGYGLGPMGASGSSVIRHNYSAPAQLQAAAWSLTAAAEHSIGCFLSHAFTP